MSFIMCRFQLSGWPLSQCTCNVCSAVARSRPAVVSQRLPLQLQRLAASFPAARNLNLTISILLLPFRHVFRCVVHLPLRYLAVGRRRLARVRFAVYTWHVSWLALSLAIAAPSCPWEFVWLSVYRLESSGLPLLLVLVSRLHVVSGLPLRRVRFVECGGPTSWTRTHLVRSGLVSECGLKQSRTSCVQMS